MEPITLDIALLPSVARRQHLSTLKQVAATCLAYGEELVRRQTLSAERRAKTAANGKPNGRLASRGAVEADQKHSSREEFDPVPQARKELAEGHERYRDANGRTVEQIIALGDLCESWAKKLSPSQWRVLFKDDDPFGENKAYQLRAIAGCEVIRKNARYVPSAIRTLHQIAQEIEDDPQRLQRAIDEKRITPDSSARDVREQLSKGSGRSDAAASPERPDRFDKDREMGKFDKAVRDAITHWIARCPEGLDDEDQDWRLYPETKLRAFAQELEDRRIASPIAEGSS